MNGLQMTRDYRKLTYWFRASFRFFSKYTFDPLESLAVNAGLISARQRTLVWTKSHTYDPLPWPQPSRPHGHTTSPSIELTLYHADDQPHENTAVQDTPAMAHSLFPPARTTHRPRNESDASIMEPTLPIYNRYRTSDDSSRSFIQRPSDVHRSRTPSTDLKRSAGGSGRRSSEFTGSRLSTEYMLSPISPPADQQGFGGWLSLNTVQSRQGYQRANSDPPPFVADAAQGGLGISVEEHDNGTGGRPTT
jgi:hypothetical protein